jgi:Polyketide cyclase / dehydrase and lipid transport
VITFETAVRIGRPLEQIYAYVSDPLNFPAWHAAVGAVREKAAGWRYLMERRLPTGRALNDLEILVRERPREFVVRTTSGPTPFVYRYLFSSEAARRSSSSTRRYSSTAPPRSCRSSRDAKSETGSTRTSRR